MQFELHHSLSVITQSDSYIMYYKTRTPAAATCNRKQYGVSIHDSESVHAQQNKK